jgi:hypothetical protein
MRAQLLANWQCGKAVMSAVRGQRVSAPPARDCANAKEVFCATCESLVSMGFGHLSRIVAVGSLAKGVRERNC